MEPAAGELELERRLVARARAGDAAAFEELYRRERAFVQRLAWRFTGHADDALDVVQETFCYLARKLPELELRARLASLLYPTVRHLAAAARRKRERHAASAAEPDMLPGSAPAPSAPALADGVGGELAALVRALPEPQREVVLLRYAEGLELAEIAAALEVPLGTVKSRLHHAHRSLREDPRVRALREDGTISPDR